ncbi:uncharacterized protein LOC125032249 [Penaeus chinensis]|uniref:uncharacterized protein LOC125032249 n=1 Tax=Penaeus chinensis TaxID=139456 RepID=UPI001FB69416|nr:uncharacterized protein LOC125032249 [Penaeus chinensis]
MAAVNPPESVLFDPGPARCCSLCVITLWTPPRPRRSAEQSPVAHGAKHFVRTTFRRDIIDAEQGGGSDVADAASELATRVSQRLPWWRLVKRELTSHGCLAGEIESLQDAWIRESIAARESRRGRENGERKAASHKCICTLLSVRGRRVPSVEFCQPLPGVNPSFEPDGESSGKYNQNIEWREFRVECYNILCIITQPPYRMLPNSLSNQKPLTFDDVYNQSSPTNCTVYCGGITNGLSEELMQKTFAPYGQIQEIRVFKDKGYAFVRFSTKESATHAIVSVHNSEINGQPVKCSWGKESGDPNNTPVTTQVMTLTDVSECLSLQPLPGSQYPYNYAGQMGYWYPQGYPAQVQGQQFLGMQGFAYGQYGYQQGIAGMAGVPTWQGVPQPQLPTGQMAQLQQPASMVGAYPVQQFQLSSPYLLGSTPGTLVQ